MATLRTPLFRQPTITADDLDALRASGMSNLRRGFESGRIGNDITGLAADEASLRADNDNVRADALRSQINALQRRQGFYAPDVQDVTKVGSVGDAVDWATGAVGQGVASMADPMAVSTGLNAAGGLISMAPNPLAKAVGTSLRWAAPVAAYGINARHLKGEVYNDMMGDPTIMANHSAQELNRQANIYGGIAGLADTAFPAVVGRQLTGAGFGKGLLKNGGARLGAELLGEGVTEAGQGYGSAYLRNTLNPNVEHNDWNERINDFAGGVAGAGPFAVGGHFADHGFRRIGDSVERVTEKAGQVKDLLDQSGATGAVKTGAQSIVGFGKGLLGRGKDSVVDLMGDENGKITPESVKQSFRDATDGITKEQGISPEDQSILRGDVPVDLRDKLDSPEFESWATQHHEERTNKVLDHLETMAEGGDKRADELFLKVNDAMTVPEHTAAVNEASKYVLDNNELQRELSNAEAFGKLAGMGGKAVGKGAVAAGKMAASFGKSVWDGMKEGAKKNMQGSLEGFDDFEGDRQSKLGGNYIQQQAAMKKSRDRAELMGEYLAAVTKAETPRFSAHRAGAEAAPAYMKSLGFEIADLADSWGLANEKGTAKAAIQPSGPASTIQTTEDKRGQQFDGLKLNLNRVVNSLRVMMGQDKAAEALNQMQSLYQGDKRIAPLFDFMRDELATQASPQGREHTAQIRDEAAQAILDKLPQEKELELMKNGISMRTPEGRKQLLSMVEQISANRAPREARVALAKLVGSQNLNEMLGVVNANLEKSGLSEVTVDDRGQTEDYDGSYAMDDNGDFIAAQSANDVDKSHAERLVAKGSGPKIYGYDYGSGMRHSTGKTDPFASTDRVSKKELAAWAKENADRATLGEELLPDPRTDWQKASAGRPNLFMRGRKLADGTDAVQKKITDMGKLLGVDRTPENAVRLLREENNEKAAANLEALIKKSNEGDEAARQRIDDNLDDFYETRAGSWDFKAKPASEVMKDHNYSLGQKLAAFRDYLYGDKEPVKARAVADMLLDMIDIQRKGEPNKQNQTRTTPKLRKQIMAAMDKYFKERDVVVGEQLSNRDNTQMTAPELLEMATQGRKVMDLARKPENADKAAGMIDRANILTFKSKLSTSKDGLLHIPAGALVYWVKSQKGMTQASNIEDTTDMGNKNKNREYLSALLEGVYQIAASGMADGLPYKLNARGEKEYFADSKSNKLGVPPSLRLATGKAEHVSLDAWKGEGESPGQYSDEYVFGKANPELSKDEVEAMIAQIKQEKGTKGFQIALNRAARKAKLDLTDSKKAFKVAVDQARGEDPFTAEPLEVVDPKLENPDYFSPESKKGQAQRLAERRKGGVKADRRGEETTTSNLGYRVNRSGKMVAEALTTDGHATPLDFFGKLPDGAQRDEFADVLGRTKEGGESVYSMRNVDLGREDATDALEKASDRSESIVEKLVSNPNEGLSDLASRLRTALRPGFVEAAKTENRVQYQRNIEAARKQPVGGKQYLFPAAAALSPENLQHVLASADVGPEEAVALKNQLFGMRKAAAGIAASLDLTPKQRVAVARMLATADKRDKITLANAQEYLMKLGENGADIDPEDTASKGGPDLSRQYQLGKTPLKPTTRPKGGPGGNVLQGPLFDGLNGPLGGGRTGEDAMGAAAEAAIQRLADKARKGGAAAPLGKSQRNGGKADWSEGGRKLNAQSTAIHEELGREGFAATHDSPHIFDGKFDWRRNTGRGEGRRDAGVDENDQSNVAQARGAGTYLSTADGVHEFYKNNFTAFYRGEDIDSLQRQLKSRNAEDAALRYAADAKNWEKYDYALGHGMSLKGDASGDYGSFVREHDIQSGDEQWRTPWSERDDGVYSSFAEAHEAEYGGSLRRHEEEIIRLKKAISEYKEKRWDKSPTYQVSVNIPHEHLLDWDKPMAEQSAHVREALKDVARSRVAGVEANLKRNGYRDGDVVHGSDGKNYTVFDDGSTGSFDFVDSNNRIVPEARAAEILKSVLGDKWVDKILIHETGGQLYQRLSGELGSNRKASDFMQERGVLGNVHNSMGSKNSEYRNYVIYDDSKITTNYVHFNAQDGKGNGMPSTEAQRQEARAYVEKVLGKDVRVAFEEAMGHSGEWVDVDNLIKISTTSAAGALETAYHEALHAFFSKYVKNNPQVFEALKTIAEDPKIVERLHALLDGHPAAQAQLAHGEERLAYAYQFWAAGKLDLPSMKARNWFQKLRNLFKRVLGMVKDSERATALFEAFHEGKLSEPSAAGKVIAAELAKGTFTKAQLRKIDTLVQWVAGKTMPSEAVLATSVSARAQALARELYTNPADPEGAKEEGYSNAKSRHAKQYSNLFKDIVNGLSDRDLHDVETHLQKQTELTDIPYTPVRKAVMDTRKLNQRFYRYMTEERGMKLGYLGPKYYPRVWSKSAMLTRGFEFVEMLKEHYPDVLAEGVKASKGKLSGEDVAWRIHSGIVNAGEFMQKRGPQRDDGVLAPYFMSNRVRDLAWLQTEHSEPFQEKNLIKTMTSYYHDGARAAEYTSRFGQDGALLDSAITEIHNELNEHSLNELTKGRFKDEAQRAKWVKSQMRDVRAAVAAQEGTLGKDIPPAWRKFNSWVVAYQNVRLLPMMLFSSMVDPMAMVARGAPMREAYDAYVRGMTEVFRNWGDMFRDQPKERQKDKWEKLAEASGIVDAALFNTHVSDEYASIYMDGKAKKINDALFKLNGMEAWDRGMRVAATRSAAMFIARHKGLPDATHSERWLSELGLTPKDIELDDRGELITDKHDLMDKLGITQEEAERRTDKMNYALSRWVQGAVLSPNAAHRPAWGSDPHYSMFFHLKQFTYSFHQTVIKNAVHEMNYGNMIPLGTFAWYIPVMIASDITKGLIQGGGELPGHMKGMDLGAWVAHGAERAGMLGLGNIAVDANKDIFSTAGPMVEQIMDAWGAPARNTALNALPLHGLYAEAMK